MPTSGETLAAGIRDKDEKVRTGAWVGAGSAGAPAVGPVGALLLDPDPEVARAARHALEKIVHHAGRPGADAEARARATELSALLANPDPRGAAPAAGAVPSAGLPSAGVRRTALWLLSEIGGDASVDAVAALLSDPALREDARCVLQRIPGPKSLQALRAALETAPAEAGEFKFALAESLRKRGERVPGYPSRKLVPTRPAGPAAAGAAPAADKR